ncbi:MAG: hypothetical protein LIP09_15045, partial [Bacteroidales bacterium]|nr:hypothetical protein [Bacteroidales bacterium]
KCCLNPLKFLYKIFDTLLNNEVLSIHPTDNEFELFLRFFEELEYAIMSERIEEEVVHDMFAFYALEISKKEGLIKDYKEPCWQTFHNFINRMNQIKEKK